MFASVIGIDPTAVSSTPEFGVGQIGAVVSNNGVTKIYKYVEYKVGSGSVAAVSGNVALAYCSPLRLTVSIAGFRSKVPQPWQQLLLLARTVTL